MGAKGFEIRGTVTRFLEQIRGTFTTPAVTTESADGQSTIKAAETVEEVAEPRPSAPQANTSGDSTIVANSAANSTKHDTLSKAQKAKRGTPADILAKAGQPESGVPGCRNKKECESQQLARTEVQRVLESVAAGKQLSEQIKSETAQEVDSFIKASKKHTVSTVATTGSAGSVQGVGIQCHEKSIPAVAAQTQCTTAVDGNVVCVSACDPANGTTCPQKHARPARRRLSGAFAQVCRKLGMTVHGERL